MLIESLGGLDADDVFSLRVAFDAGAVKFKVNDRVWSPGFGVVERAEWPQLAQWSQAIRETGDEVELRLNGEEAGVVFDALAEHARVNTRRHADAVAWGDTVSTTGDRVAICQQVMTELMRSTL